MKESIRIFNEIKTRALPIIKSYQKDLLCWDLAAILRNPGIPFIHFTGDTGTHIEPLTPADKYPERDEKVRYLFGWADRNHILNGKMESVKCMKRVNRQDLILFYNGKTVKEITQKEAEAIIEEYTRSIRRQWAA